MKFKIAIIGLGYVGLPLAVEFSRKFPTIGYDINGGRIKELKRIKGDVTFLFEQLMKVKLLSLVGVN